jgi:hypothetical protein
MASSSIDDTDGMRPEIADFNAWSGTSWAR